jgi:hypothetical protein
MAGNRKLETVDPEIASLALTLLAPFATDAPDKTPLDLELAKRSGWYAGGPSGCCKDGAELSEGSRYRNVERCSETVPR